MPCHSAMFYFFQLNPELLKITFVDFRQSLNLPGVILLFIMTHTCIANFHNLSWPALRPRELLWLLKLPLCITPPFLGLL